MTNNSLVRHGFKGDGVRYAAASLACFCSFVNSDGCLHVGRHLNQTPLLGVLKHLVILPKHHSVTRLVINEDHESCEHLGYNYVLSCL